MTQMIKPFQIRAYAREGITRIPLDVQKFEIQRVADELDLKIEWYIGTAKPKSSILDERDLWAKQLRYDEIGLVHSLPVLRLTGKQLNGADPKADFSGFMASIGGLYQMEAVTGITSKQRPKWRQAVSLVTEKPPPGTKPIGKKRASELAKIGWQTRNKGVVPTWQSGARKSERELLILHWKAARTAKVAHETLPAFIEQMGGGVYNELAGISEPTLRRICKTKQNT